MIMNTYTRPTCAIVLAIVIIFIPTCCAWCASDEVSDPELWIVFVLAVIAAYWATAPREARLK